MSTSRALSWTEVSAISKHLKPPRDTCLFWLLLGSGLRLTETTSLTVSDAVDDLGRIKDFLSVQPAKQRGRVRTRDIPIGATLTFHLNGLLQDLQNQNPYTYLFQSRKGTNLPISNRHARRILTDAFKAAGSRDHCSPHSLRKTFAQSIFDSTGENIFLAQQALGHVSPATTVYYINAQQPLVHKAIKDVLDSHLAEEDLFATKNPESM